jgi:hypothetical protein
MDLIKLIADLRVELKQVEQTIQTLEAMAGGDGKRRGRPPKWLTEARQREAETVPAAEPKPTRKRAAKQSVPA